MPEECLMILGMALPDHCFSGILRGRIFVAGQMNRYGAESREADSGYLDRIGMEVAGYDSR